MGDFMEGVVGRDIMMSGRRTTEWSLFLYENLVPGRTNSEIIVTGQSGRPEWVFVLKSKTLQTGPSPEGSIFCKHQLIKQFSTTNSSLLSFWPRNINILPSVYLAYMIFQKAFAKTLKNLACLWCYKRQWHVSLHILHNFIFVLSPNITVCLNSQVVSVGPPCFFSDLHVSF